MTAAHVDAVRSIAAHVVADMFTGIGSTKSSSASDAEGLRLSVGRLLSDISASMDAAASARSPLRVALYAAHDTTVLPLLLALQSSASPQRDAFTWPPYAASIALELWAPKTAHSHAEPHAAAKAKAAAAEQQHYVRALYNGRLVHMPCAPAGSAHGACTLTAFQASLGRYLPRDFHAECAVGAGAAAADKPGGGVSASAQA